MGGSFSFSAMDFDHSGEWLFHYATAKPLLPYKQQAGKAQTQGSTSAFEGDTAPTSSVKWPKYPSIPR